MHDGVDFLAVETVPQVVEQGLPGLGCHAAAPISSADYAGEVDSGSGNVAESLRSALADKSTGFGVAYGPQPPTFGLPTALVSGENV